MNKPLLYIIFLFSIIAFGQKHSKTQVLYEGKDMVILNNGEQYEVVLEKPFYYIQDDAIKQFKQIDNTLLKLNRILVIKNNKEYKKLVEWVEKDLKYYECNSISVTKLKQDFSNDMEIISTN